ncbi:MAG: oligosaccharide flippase family protein [Bacteroidales bacterium]|nr:oligosaccharide flippase family protein [Bacteroidales bacterium]
MADARRLAKNTLLMYLRMILIMVVSIYTSRIVLDKLGVDDYGLYNAVASIVAMVSFLNATLSTSTSRFLTYDLGQGNFSKLRDTFSTSFYTHLVLAVIVVLILETVGLWYMGNKFVIPEGREDAVHTVFQISVLTTAIAIIQVPYTASIMAHENMDVYAYMGIAEVLLKLGIVYLLLIIPFDKLIIYASLIALVQAVLTLSYFIICHIKYPETHLVRCFRRDTFKGMMGFSGWTAVANLSNAAVVQGSTVLLNLFFAPAIIAAKALANQVTSAVMQFVNNFRVALNPQIIKSYAAGEDEEFKKWSLRSTVVTCDLLVVIGFPCIASMKTILDIWLVEVPPLAVEFTQLAIFSQIISSISSSTYIPFVASGKLKLNAIWGTITGFGYFIFLYLCFKIGAGALWVQWLNLILALIMALGIRPYLLHQEIGFSYDEVFKCIFDCFKPIVVSGVISYGLSLLLGNAIWEQILLFIMVFLTCCCSVWLFLEKPIRIYLVNILKSRLHRE